MDKNRIHKILVQLTKAEIVRPDVVALLFRLSTKKNGQKQRTFFQKKKKNTVQLIISPPPKNVVKKTTTKCKHRFLHMMEFPFALAEEGNRYVTHKKHKYVAQ